MRDWKPWAERWVGAYLLLTSVPMVFGPGANRETIVGAMQQWLVAAAVLMLSRYFHRAPRWEWLSWAMWAPLLPWTYGHIDLVQRALKRPLYDTEVQAWEKGIFGLSPALEWSRSWNYLLFSELLHAFYFAYYLVLPLLILRLLKRGLNTRARLTLAGGVATLVGSYVVNIAFPVQGPRPIQPPLSPDLRGWFWQLTHYICDQGAAAAAAFPSGHVALAALVLGLGFAWDRRWTPVYLVLLLGIWAGTVYGRFHYVVDGVAGLALGLICAYGTWWALGEMAEEDMPV
jgi:membrane-associated phospholipid phosphatase